MSKKAAFEAWFNEEYPEFKLLGSEYLSMQDDIYQDEFIQSLWSSWKAATSSIKVMIPERRSVPDRDCWARTNALGYNQCHGEFTQAIEAAGVRVKS